MFWKKKEPTIQDNVSKFVRDNQFAVGVVLGGIGIVTFYKSRNFLWKRIRTDYEIPYNYWKNKKIMFGTVSHVGDGDGFHFVHLVIFFYSKILFGS